MNFRANSQSKLKFTKQFKKFSGYLVIKRQLLLLNWEFIPRRDRGFTQNYFLGLGIASNNSDTEASNIFTNQAIAIITATDTPP
jgi:hypothetical protein